VESILANYTDALQNCTNECIRSNESGQYIINNQIWELNQKKLFESRRSLSDREIDHILKLELHNKLTEIPIINISDHVIIKFQVVFETGDTTANTIKKVVLCESCYRIFNNHICKHFLMIL
jgi:hypothetical protein